MVPAGKAALEGGEILAGGPAVAEAVADGAPQGICEVAERLGAQEGVVPALAALDLREALAAEPGGFERELLEGAGGRVEGVVQRVARDVRRDAADQALPLLGADGARGPEPEVADLGLLEPVVGPDADLLEREAPQRGVAEGRHGVGEWRAEPGPAARELVELEAPAEGTRPDGERRLAEVGLREGEDDVAPERADVAVQHEPLPAAEEVILLDADVEDERVGRA